MSSEDAARRDVQVRLYGDLSQIANGAGRDGVVDVPFGSPRSVKDLLESVGVPHTEIDLVLVDGLSVDFDHPVVPGDRVAAYPRFHDLDVDAVSHVRPPAPAPRFVLDVHLGGLARRLRMLGFDTWYRTEADDETLARVAVEQDRILVTRDRGLLMRREVVHGYCPRSDDTDEQTIEVVRRFELIDRLDPFTRCVNCNGELAEVDKVEVLDELPPRTRVEHDDFTRCTSCGQVYWPGSHREQMGELVDRVRAEART